MDFCFGSKGAILNRLLIVHRPKFDYYDYIVDDHNIHNEQSASIVFRFIETVFRVFG
jgi:hypothetical protein